MQDLILKLESLRGGFPCQDLSVAGKRAGLAGNRSGLFWQICRLLEETKSKYFILENVPGLLSSNDGRDMATVISALVKLGYGVGYRILDAQHFGVPQRRKRIFIVGCLGDDGSTPAKILSILEGRTGYLEASKQKRKNIATATTTGVGVSLSNGKSIANCIPAELYHKSTVVNQDVNSGHLVLTQSSYSPSSFAEYKKNENVSATLRAGGGDLGGGSETLLLHQS